MGLGHPDRGPSPPPTAPEWVGRVILSLGHSTLPIEEFLARLADFGVVVLADVRSVPGSRRNPQFGQEALRRSVEERGIEYAHLRDLGGLRKKAANPDPKNAGWENDSFRNYADYMATDGFARGLEALRVLAAKGPTAILCAEAVPWRCHRSLVSDALWARGVVVRHVLSRTRADPHRPTPFARFDGLEVTYPAP